MVALAADLVVVVHLAFVVWAVLGGLAAHYRPWLAWLHLPALAWAVAVEWAGWVCPLTPLEKALRKAAGESSYSGGFVEHVLAPVLYPPGLTREHQWVLGGLLVGINLLIYARLLKKVWGATHKGEIEP